MENPFKMTFFCLVIAVSIDIITIAHIMHIASGICILYF
jgi:hypothetical protein